MIGDWFMGPNRWGEMAWHREKGSHGEVSVMFCGLSIALSEPKPHDVGMRQLVIETGHGVFCDRCSSTAVSDFVAQSHAAAGDLSAVTASMADVAKQAIDAFAGKLEAAVDAGIVKAVSRGETVLACALDEVMLAIREARR